MKTFKNFQELKNLVFTEKKDELQIDVNERILNRQDFVINNIYFRFTGAKNEILCFNNNALMIFYGFGRNLLDAEHNLTMESIMEFLNTYPGYSKFRIHKNTPKTVHYNGQDDHKGLCFGISLWAGKPVFESDFY
ncbi:hypothetical protein [Epilithonimonas sp.]|uniref:hypothetical protein n=1 Tax=Epilithonimonas sp. TaxID=2894511 RepID=UPI0035B04A3C